MLPYSTLREFFRIPLIRENREAVKFLNEAFYLLIALHRAGRLRDFNCLKCVYFEMFDSFAQYGRRDARDTLDRLLELPWFKTRHRDLLRTISSYKLVVECLNKPPTDNEAYASSTQMEVNKNMVVFVKSFKELIDFNMHDENRVAEILHQPEVMDESINLITSVFQNRRGSESN